MPQSPYFIIGLILTVTGIAFGFWIRSRIKSARSKLQAISRSEMQNISEFASQIMHLNTVDDVLWVLMQSCISKLGFVDGVVYLHDMERNVLVQKAAFGPKNPRPFEILNPIELQIGQGIVGSVALEQKGEIIADTRKDPRYIKDDAMRLSELAVPIMYRNELIGVIDSEHPDKGFFNEHHLQILQMLSALCASKIAGMRAQEEKKLYFNRLQALFELTPDFILVSDPTGQCKYANRSYLKFFGFDFNPLNKNSKMPALNHEQYFEFVEKIKTITRNEPSISYFKQSFGSGGRKQWTLWNETGVFNEAGELAEIISVGRDITELRQSAELKDRHIRTLEEILYKNSHRVRQPVAQLMGLAQIIESGTESKEELKKMVAFIKQSVSQLDYFTRELNEYVMESRKAG